MLTLKYNGRQLLWIEDGSIKYRFAATSGMAAFSGEPSYQRPRDQCVSDAGPIPEGTYALRLRFDGNLIAFVADPATCRLQAAQGIQQIPDGDPRKGTAHCTPYWNNWGANRVRIDAYDAKAKKACQGSRSGFYIHDSQKGYTHGCIEVEHAFFTRLYDLVNSNPKQKLMLLDVNYAGATSTLGSTKSH